ncbi:acetyl-CoA carboxylase biotin carboxyl carrier protein [Aquibacillus salsiterrae]|uniref:Biotin carboxyl carrier protein of acetyl-CoA carboxylase n=1 Tax=Aquibacillus salsiterrae TaxID=2950439 RepID=A0A9X3WEB0_9BACI|nr:acetyl-CoA carboxylase biotin carboxyl carrier protein [Aquibacillus salsiterrae]MDC3415486.1 acetyl-CoA carboxylase biotin carboxyl carrier protein [Aquibacillus salsiterrae]
MLKIEEIHELIKRIDESSIDEFTFESNGTKVSVKKNKQEATLASPVQVQAQAPVPTQVQEQPVTKPQETNNQVDENVNSEQQVNYDYEIVSPMVGTFYSAPSPDKDDYVKIGDKVSADTVVCIVEAMKLFNEIEADVNGEVVEVLVESGELVEYGQPLYRVKKM